MNPIQDALNDALVDDEDFLLLVLHFHPQNGKSKTFDSEDFKFHLRPRPQPRPSSSDLLVNQNGSKKCKVTSLSVDDEAALEMGTPFTTQQTNQQGPCPQTPVARRNLSSSLVESTIQTPAPTRFSLRTPPRSQAKVGIQARLCGPHGSHRRRTCTTNSASTPLLV